MEDRSVALPWRDLGLRTYAEALELQEELRRQVLTGKSPGELLLVEHPPTISLGRAEHGSNLLVARDELIRLGFDVVESSRGGKVTYHGPGQLVAYPIVDLRSFKMGVKQYVAALEETMIGLLGTVGLPAERREGCIGAWVCGRKIGSIGIHVRKQVAIHGLALNICPDLSHFDRITPCGIAGVTMTSVKNEGIEVSFEEAKRRFIQEFGRVFDRTMISAVSSCAEPERKVNHVQVS